MATYCYAHRGAAVPYNGQGGCVLRRIVDLPDRIANPSKLALAAAPTTPLSSFTAFGAADILELFEVPAGFTVTHVGARVTTEEGATCTADIGNCSATQTHRLSANPDGLQGTLDLDSEGTQVGLIADEDLGGSTYECVVFVTAGSIDITFGHAATDTCIFDVWVNGFMAW